MTTVLRRLNQSCIYKIGAWKVQYQSADNIRFDVRRLIQVESLAIFQSFIALCSDGLRLSVSALSVSEMGELIVPCIPRKFDS